MSLGSIIVSVEYNQLYQLESREFDWEGGDYIQLSWQFLKELDISDTALKPGTKFRVGPFVLRSTGCRGDPLLRQHIGAVRTYDLWSWLLYWRVRLTPHIRLYYHRLILTLVIWNLAKYQEGCIPSWRDIGKT